MIRVLVVDDSSAWQSFLKMVLNDCQDIELVDCADNGAEALDLMSKYNNIDIILLDIEMPLMNGLEALPLIVKLYPKVKVIMVSMLSKPEAKITLEALYRGATDFIPKPSFSQQMSSDDVFSEKLIYKIRACCRHKRGFATSIKRIDSGDLLNKTYKALAIGASTGGPKAISDLVSKLSSKFTLPIFIVLHMPPVFTEVFAESLQLKTKYNCVEAKDGDIVKGGTIYIAPGGWHMEIKEEKHKKIICLNDSPPVNFVRPAVDVLFFSLAKVYKDAALALILTGIGKDGKKGASTLKDAGSNIFVQDQDSSVVWGMPGEIAKDGNADQVLPLDKLAKAVDKAILNL